MKKLTLIALCAIVSLAACKKDRDNSKPITMNAREFKEKFTVPTQVFTENAGTEFTITGEKGISLKFPANAFLDASGEPVSGSIKLTLKEVLSKRDILLSGKMTESNGQLLVSGGEFEIRASKDGQELKLNPASEVITRVPKTLSSEPMQFFMFEPIVGTSDSTWALNQKTRVQDTPEYYQFSLPGFGWANCDYFYSDARPKTTITASPVYPGAAPSIKHQNAYMVFNDINTVVGMPFNIDLNKHKSYDNSMPIGLTGKIVIISIDMNDNIYFGHANLTVSDSGHTDVNVSMSTQTDIDNFLNTLD